MAGVEMRLMLFWCSPRELLEEVIDEQQEVGFPLPQRRHEDREDVEAVVQVLAEGAGGDRALHVLVGGGDEAHVDLDGLGAAQALELPLLQHPQQLHLGGQVDVADLVEEQRAALGELEPPLLALLGAGEGALLVAEQLRLDQAVGQRGAVHLDERLVGARRVVVDGVGHQLLARARLASDEHGGVGGRHLRHLLVHLAHRPAAADDAREVVALLQLLPQLRVLVEQLLLVFLDQPLNLDRLRDRSTPRCRRNLTLRS